MQFYAFKNAEWEPKFFNGPHPSNYWYMSHESEVVRLDKDTGERLYSQPSVAELYDILGPLYDGHIKPQINDFRSAMNFKGDINTVALPNVLSHTGEFLPVLPPYRVDFPVIKTNNQPRYEKATQSKTGDIVVSPFQRGYLEIFPGPAHVYSGLGSEGQRSLDGDLILGSHKPTRLNPVVIGGVSFTRLPLAMLKFQLCFATEVEGNYDVDSKSLIEAIVNGCVPQGPALTECVAAANAGTVDALTAIAEAPATLKNAMRGVMTILKMYKEARSRDFRLKDRVKEVKTRWNREISRLENQTIRDSNAIATANAQFTKDVNQLLHAITGVWLTYRLEIFPLSKDVEGLIGAHFGDHLVEFLRFREFSRYTIPYQDQQIPMDYRVFIKRSIIPGKELAAYFSVNVAKTLWELGWLTFVVDRYIAIGDWLSANLSNPRVYTHKEGATHSWNSKSVIKVNDCIVNITFKKRSVFSSDIYCPIYFPPERSIKQDADHLALLWKLFSKRL